jgi:hypothetical protein
VFEQVVLWLKARVRALFPSDWSGSAGERFRATLRTIAEYNKEYIRPVERVKEAPELGWKRLEGEAHEKRANAVLSYAQEEGEKIKNEVARRTMDDQVRISRANADKCEAEARLAQLNEATARIEFIERCRKMGVTPHWENNEQINVLPVPPNFDWGGLERKLIEDQTTEQGFSSLAESADIAKRMKEIFAIEQTSEQKTHTTEFTVDAVVEHGPTARSRKKQKRKRKNR